MKITIHPSVKRYYFLNQNSQYLKNKLAVCIKHDTSCGTIVERISPYFLCRDYINDFAYSLYKQKEMNEYGMIIPLIPFDVSTHKFGIMITKIPREHQTQYIQLLSAIMSSAVQEVSPVETTFKIQRYRESVVLFVPGTTLEYIPLISFISFLMKLCVYLMKINVQLTPGIDSMSRLRQTMRTYLHRIYNPELEYVNLLLPTNDALLVKALSFKILKNSTVTDYNNFHNTSGFVSCLRYAKTNQVPPAYLKLD